MVQSWRVVHHTVFVKLAQMARRPVCALVYPKIHCYIGRCTCSTLPRPWNIANNWRDTHPTVFVLSLQKWNVNLSLTFPCLDSCRMHGAHRLIRALLNTLAAYCQNLRTWCTVGALCITRYSLSLRRRHADQHARWQMRLLHIAKALEHGAKFARCASHGIKYK